MLQSIREKVWLNLKNNKTTEKPANTHTHKFENKFFNRIKYEKNITTHLCDLVVLRLI